MMSESANEIGVTETKEQVGLGKIAIKLMKTGDEEKSSSLVR